MSLKKNEINFSLSFIFLAVKEIISFLFLFWTDDAIVFRSLDCVTVERDTHIISDVLHSVNVWNGRLDCVVIWSLWYFIFSLSFLSARIFFYFYLCVSEPLSADLFSLSNLIWREWDNVSASRLASDFDATGRHRVCRSNFQLQSLSLWSIPQKRERKNKVDFPT